jgi:hypothetical protein
MLTTTDLMYSSTISRILLLGGKISSAQQGITAMVTLDSLGIFVT